MKTNGLHMVIAAGGTGGHLFPAIAVAHKFVERNPNNRVLFISTGKPLDKTVLSKTGFQHQWIVAEGIKRRGLIRQIMAVFKIPTGVIQSARILKAFKPSLVMGVGSYVAGPVVMAAWLMGLKIVLHEQNMIPGMTNRMLAPFAHRIYVSFEKTREGLNPKKTLFTGNPVRKEILTAGAEDGFDRKKEHEIRPFTVLIIGGSQGAHRINLAMAEAARHLNKDRFFIVHQTGDSDCEQVSDAYRDCNIGHTVQPFFYDMADQYQKADLVICRAGATTVAEITALGKGVIFIPYPFAADDHQTLNAQALSHNGAAEMILERDVDGHTLAERIEFYASHPDALDQMAARAKALGRPDAAEMIVEDLYRRVIADSSTTIHRRCR